MTLNKFLLLGGVAATLASAATATGAAETAHVDTDAQCLAVSLAMAGSQEAATRTLGSQGVTYFLGRIDGRGGKADVEARLASQFEAFNHSQALVSKIANSCMQLMSGRAAAFKTVVEHLQPRFGRPQAAAAPAPSAPLLPVAPSGH